MTAAPGRNPPAGRSADSAETTWRLVEGRDRIAGEISDVVVHRLYTVGLSLQGALGLMDGHRAGENIKDAIAELDQAIVDLRGAVFGAPAPDPQTDTSG